LQHGSLAVVFFWLIGAVFIFSVVPVIFAVIMPTNYLLLIPGRDLASDDTRRWLVRWASCMVYVTR